MLDWILQGRCLVCYAGERACCFRCECFTSSVQQPRMSHALPRFKTLVAPSAEELVEVIHIVFAGGSVDVPVPQKMGDVLEAVRITPRVHEHHSISIEKSQSCSVSFCSGGPRHYNLTGDGNSLVLFALKPRAEQTLFILPAITKEPGARGVC